MGKYSSPQLIQGEPALSDGSGKIGDCSRREEGVPNESEKAGVGTDGSVVHSYRQ